MAKANVVLDRKRTFDDGAISELTLWLLPEPVLGSRHPFKYSLFHGRQGERLIGYGNESGKGGRQHYGEREEPYAFVTPEQLLEDFLADVRAARRHRRT
jgi:hypothetical protein